MASSTITELTASATVDPGFTCYVLNLGPAGATVTLPPIIADGQNYSFIRIDTSSGPAVLAGTGNDIVGPTTGPTYPVATNTSVAIEALGGRWVVVAETSLYSSGRKTYFATSFVQNNGALKLTVPGTGTFPTPATVVCEFTFGGATRDTIRQADVLLDANRTGSAIYLAVTDRVGQVLGSTTVSGVPTTTSSYTFAVPITGTLPAAQGTLQIRANIDGGKNNQLGIYSLLIF